MDIPQLLIMERSRRRFIMLALMVLKMFMSTTAASAPAKPYPAIFIAFMPFCSKISYSMKSVISVSLRFRNSVSTKLLACCFLSSFAVREKERL